VLTLTRKQII